MKMKRWLSRGIVLAMVVALMVPMPVLAKGKSGGKLVKSVERYTYQPSGRWKAESKQTFKYDKKKNPVEFGHISYGDQTFLGVPVGGTKTVTTAKYKYKGKTPKSAKFKNGAGKIDSTRRYKKGRVVSIAYSQRTSDEDYTWVENPDGTETKVYKGDDVSAESSIVSIAYDKKGLATAYASAYAENTTYADGSTPYNYSSSTNETYTNVQKKGIPSLILTAWSHVSGTSTTPDTETYYDKFNSKGLVVERGFISKTNGAYIPTTIIQYSMKKGKVSQAVVYDVDANEAGAITKTTPETLYKFKYAKTKISKARYFKMVNSFVGANAFFAWY